MQQIITEIKKSLDEMRYYTYGDYYLLENGDLKFDIVDHKNDNYTYLTLVHELLEYFLLRAKGIDISIIDEFDQKFEEDPERVKLYTEPGADPTAPYYEEHAYANTVVKYLCDTTGLDYEEWLNIDLDNKISNIKNNNENQNSSNLGMVNANSI
jgi:hypothetical protein